MTSASSSARRRRSRRHAGPRPAPPPAPGPSSPLAPTDQEWLWSDNHDTINQWFLTKPHINYEEFYASFINFANRAWELSRYQDRAPLEGLQKSVVELLQQEPIPANELLTALQEYLVGQGDGKARWKENGLVPFALGLGKVSILTYPALWFWCTECRFRSSSSCCRQEQVADKGARSPT